MNLNSLLPRLNLSPDAGDAGGGADMGGGAGSGAGGQGGSEGSGSTSYVPKADFERVSGEFNNYRSQQDRRFQELEARLPKQERQENKGPKNPYDNLDDYKFNDPVKGRQELQRFNRDTFRYEQTLYSQEQEKERAPQLAQQRKEESMRRASGNFDSLIPDYEKENPGFRQRFQGANLETYTEVQEMLMGHKQSPAIIDHLISHPEALSELNSVAMQGGERAAAQYIGEMAAEIRHNKTILKGRENAFRAQPTAGGFSRSSVTPNNDSFVNKELSPKEQKKLKDLYR